MSRRQIKLKKWCVIVSRGGLTLGLLQGLGMVNFASLFTNVLITVLQILVTLLLGGDVSQLLGT